MPSELMLCIPGPWQDKASFLRAVVSAEPAGHYFYGAQILADVETKAHVAAEWYEKNASEMRRAFELAGGGRLSKATLDQIEAYQSVVYLRFSLPVAIQWTNILKFSQFLRQIGGIAVKVETSGVAHEWDGWETLIASEAPSEWYWALVTLIGGTSTYYSCGMHHFEEPDAEISRDLPPAEAARLLNNFNFYRLTENPALDNGHTMSLGQNGQIFELQLYPDLYHDPDDLFHNPHGLWRLTAK